MTEYEELKEIVKDHARDDEKVHQITTERLTSIEQKLDRILEIYDGLNFVGRFLVRGGVIAGALTAIVGALWAIAQIIRQLK